MTSSARMIRDFFPGFIKLHVLYHATEAPIVGLDMIRELQSHGYSLSPGTHCPLLHRVEKDGYLQSAPQVVNGKVRKYYVATRKGKKALAEARSKASELLAEIGER